MALAGALRAADRENEAIPIIRELWRDETLTPAQAATVVATGTCVRWKVNRPESSTQRSSSCLISFFGATNRKEASSSSATSSQSTFAAVRSRPIQPDGPI